MEDNIKFDIVEMELSCEDGKRMKLASLLNKSNLHDPAIRKIFYAESFLRIT